MSQPLAPITSLANEVLLIIADLLTLADTSAWLQTSSFFAHQLAPFLYSRIATHPLTPKQSVLSWAAETNRTSILEKIHAHAPSIPPATSTQALCYAAKHNHLDAAALLLKMGARVNDRACIKYQWEYTALHEAAAASNIDMARLLLSHGANIHATGSASGGWFADDTVLEWAAQHADLDMIKFLLASGADITTGGMIKRAVQSQRVDIVAFLLDKGARLAGPYENNTPHLYWVVVSKRLPMLKLLLERGADPNENTDTGTALHTAAELGDVEAVKMLLEHGAEVNVLDEGESDSPLHKAAEYPEGDIEEPYSRERVVALLLEHGADPFLLNESGDPPIQEARMWGNRTIIRMLKEEMKRLRPDDTEWVEDESGDEEEDDDECDDDEAADAR